MLVGFLLPNFLCLLLDAHIMIPILLFCRGSRGVDAIMKGAFQRVSAHIAVDAIGGKKSYTLHLFLSLLFRGLFLTVSIMYFLGKFWQLMLAGTRICLITPRCCFILLKPVLLPSTVLHHCSQRELYKVRVVQNTR